jgi:hypothetical protein
MAYGADLPHGEAPTQLMVFASEPPLLTGPYATPSEYWEVESYASALMAVDYAAKHSGVDRFVTSNNGSDSDERNGSNRVPIAVGMLGFIGLCVATESSSDLRASEPKLDALPFADGPHNGLLLAVRQGLIDTSKPLGLVAPRRHMPQALKAARRVAPDMPAVPIVVEPNKDRPETRLAKLRAAFTERVYDIAMADVFLGDDPQIDRRDFMVRSLRDRLVTVAGQVAVPVYAARRIGRISATYL